MLPPPRMSQEAALSQFRDIEAVKTRLGTKVVEQLMDPVFLPRFRRYASEHYGRLSDPRGDKDVQEVLFRVAERFSVSTDLIDPGSAEMRRRARGANSEHVLFNDRVAAEAKAGPPARAPSRAATPAPTIRGIAVVPPPPASAPLTGLKARLGPSLLPSHPVYAQKPAAASPAAPPLRAHTAGLSHPVAARNVPPPPLPLRRAASPDLPPPPQHPGRTMPGRLRTLSPRRTARAVWDKDDDHEEEDEPWWENSRKVIDRGRPISRSESRARSASRVRFESDSESADSNSMFGSDESADEASDNDTDEGFRSNDDDDDWEGDKSNDFGFDDEPTKPRKDSHLPTTGKNGGLRSKSPAPGRNGGSLRSKSPAPGRNGGSLRSKSPAPGRHGGSLRSKSPAPGGRATNLRAKSPGPGGLRRGASGTGSTKRRLPPAPPARGKGGKDKEVRFNLDSEHRNAGNGFSWADDAEKEYGPVTQRRNRRIRKSNDDWD